MPPTKRCTNGLNTGIPGPTTSIQQKIELEYLNEIILPGIGKKNRLISVAAVNGIPLLTKLAYPDAISSAIENSWPTNVTIGGMI